MKEEPIKHIKGIVTPLVTPLAGRDKLDESGFERLIEHVLQGGVHGVFLLGSSGEAPSLSRRLRNEVVERGCAQIAGRVPVLVGITDTSFEESVQLAHLAERAGANALVVAPPFYFSSSQRELTGYMKRLAAEVPLPVYLYNIPSCTKVRIAPETVAELAEVPGIIGLKDSSGDMNYFHQVLELLRGKANFPVMMGPEELLAEGMALGAAGGVCGGSNFFPELFTGIYRAVAAGNYELAFSLHRTVIHISRGIYSADHDGGFYLKGLKCALGLMGICNDLLAEPFERLTEAESRQVERVLGEVGLLPGEPADPARELCRVQDLEPLMAGADLNGHKE